MLQAGTPVTTRTSVGVQSALTATENAPIAPGISAVNFYTQFSNPTSPNYTWNRSLPTSLNMFLSNSLGVYFGFASEILSIQQKNANLNFDVTYLPQIKGGSKNITYGHMYGLSIVKQSKDVTGAFGVINALVEPSSLSALIGATGLPPVRRDLLTNMPTDAYKVVFYNSALISNSWIDPDGVASSNTFRNMIESITGGRLRTTEALSAAEDEINAELR